MLIASTENSSKLLHLIYSKTIYFIWKNKLDIILASMFHHFFSQSQICLNLQSKNSWKSGTFFFSFVHIDDDDDSFSRVQYRAFTSCRKSRSRMSKCARLTFFCLAIQIGFYSEDFSVKAAVWKCNRHRSRCRFSCRRAHIPSFSWLWWVSDRPFPVASPSSVSTTTASRLKTERYSRFYPPFSSVLLARISQSIDPTINISHGISVKRGAHGRSARSTLRRMNVFPHRVFIY